MAFKLAEISATLTLAHDRIGGIEIGNRLEASFAGLGALGQNFGDVLGFSVQCSVFSVQVSGFGCRDYHRRDLNTEHCLCTLLCHLSYAYMYLGAGSERGGSSDRVKK
jgi:hypothetical protein